MLLSAVLILKSVDAEPFYVARTHVHNWFLTTFKELDLALFRELHEGSHRRPYTLSVVNEPQDDGPPWLRITSADDRLTAFLQDRLLAEVLVNGLTFDPEGGRGNYEVMNLLTGPADRPPFVSKSEENTDPALWAGSTSYDSLIRAAMMDDHPPRWLNLHFATCTSFRQSEPKKLKRNLPLPVPRYIFKSHLRAWDALSPAPLPLDMSAFLDHYVWGERSPHRNGIGVIQAGETREGCGLSRRREL